MCAPGALTTEGKILVLCPHIFVFEDTDTRVFVKVLNTGAYYSLEKLSQVLQKSSMYSAMLFSFNRTSYYLYLFLRAKPLVRWR